MNIVLYTQDFEPITVIDLPMWLLDKVDSEGYVKVAVPKRLDIKNIAESAATGSPLQELYDTITIIGTRLYWRDGTPRTIYTTTAKDEELALVLKPNWLPGQRMQINNYQEAITFLATQLKHHIKKNDLD
jgi:hypothetical protein